MAAPSLLSLPTELRIEIYQYIFAAHETIHNPWLGLLLTSRTLHAEISDVLKDATLRVRLQPRILHYCLAENLTLRNPSGNENMAFDAVARLAYFQTYCMRFGTVEFDITATQAPTDCRLQPTYQRRGDELAAALTAEFTSTVASTSKGPSIAIRWGSFSRNVYRGITTWDVCVLKGLGGLMMAALARDEGLAEVLYCAIVLEEGHRRGLLNPSSLLLSKSEPLGHGALGGTAAVVAGHRRFARLLADTTTKVKQVLVRERA
jgi:hypothetical protein